MKYYIRVEGKNIKQIGNTFSEQQPIEIEAPIEFRSEGVCKNNWSEILNWIENNTDYKSFYSCDR
jgi:hypothetical protein